MVENDKKVLEIKKKILLETIGKIVLSERTKQGKGINKFSFEYDIGNGLLSRLEHGKTDTQISTLWKIADALDIRFSEFAKKIEDNLPDDFNFYD